MGVKEIFLNYGYIVCISLKNTKLENMRPSFIHNKYGGLLLNMYLKRAQNSLPKSLYIIKFGHKYSCDILHILISSYMKK